MSVIACSLPSYSYIIWAVKCNATNQVNKQKMANSHCTHWFIYVCMYGCMYVIIFMKICIIDAGIRWYFSVLGKFVLNLHHLVKK